MSSSAYKTSIHTEMTQLFSERGTLSAAARIVRCISAQGYITASEISRCTGLARSTVSTVLSDLRDVGIVVETSPDASVPRLVGRPVKRVSLNPHTGTAVGIHLGLAEIELAVLDMAHNFVCRSQLTLGRDYAPSDAVEAALEELTSEFAQHDRSFDGLIGIGISVSGPVSPDGRVLRSSILPQWAGVNIFELFSPRFECPVKVENEANCGAIAEMTWGAAVGEPDFVSMKIGLGVGGAIIKDGRLVTGIAGGAGEFGHICLVPDGALCRCGNRGCLETIASFATPLEQLNASRGTSMDLGAAIELAKGGDVEIRGLIRQAAENAGWGLSVLCSATNPPLVIIGGLMAQAGDLLMEPLLETYERHLMIKPQELQQDFRTRIELGRFLSDDSLRGAAGLVLHSIDSIVRQAAQ